MILLLLEIFCLTLVVYGGTAEIAKAIRDRK